MARQSAEYKGYKIQDNHFVFPNGKSINLENVRNQSSKNRVSVWYAPAQKKVKLYRAVMCVWLGLDCLPNDVEVHHVNMNACDCTIGNLVLMNHKEHKQAHRLADKAMEAFFSDVSAGLQARETYLNFVRENSIDL